MGEGSPISIDEYCLSPNSSFSIEEHCLSTDSQFSIEEYCLSTDSQFSIKEYCLSTDSPYSIEEYCLSSSSIEPRLNKESCEEFSIEEYDINKDTDNEGNGKETSKISGGQPNNNEIDCNVVTPISEKKTNQEARCILKEYHVEFGWPNLTW